MAGTAKQALEEAKVRGINVPKAWTNVQVSNSKNSALQVTGKDSKGRTQRIYSAEHSAKASAEKFARLKEFTSMKSQLDSKIMKDFNKSEEAKTLYLISKTGFRMGSTRDRGAKVKAFGASTLTSDHITVKGNTISFKFTGKKGVTIQKTITDAGLAKAFSGKTGKLTNTSEKKVRAYLAKIDGNFKVKDFRTYKGTATAIRTIKSMPVPKNAKERKVAIATVAKTVAKTLGNTPAVAKSSYIAPEVWSMLGG